MAANAKILARAPAALSRAPMLAYIPAMDASPDDSALMLRYKDGDVAAFETLYRRHNDSLYRYLLRLSRHPDTAEDVFQEAWGASPYRPTARFSTYLYRVAHNCFIDHVRRNKRHTYAVVTDPEHQPDPGEAPDTQTERALARRRLLAALDDLPDEQKDVFLLHEEAGLTLDDIASITDCNRETAKSRLRYAVNKLRAAIDEPARGS